MQVRSPMCVINVGKHLLRQNSLSRHKLTHTHEKLDVCDFCRKAFTLAGSQHTNTSIQVRSLISVGTWELKVFLMEIYLSMYSCEKSYVCDFCGKAFTLAFSQHTNVSIQVRSHVYVINVGRH